MSDRSAAIFDPSIPYSPLSIKASQTALLLLDYQNLTVSFLGDDAKRTLQVASQMRAWALEKGMAVFHCLIDTKSGVGPQPGMKLNQRWNMFEQMLKTTPQLGDEPEEIAAPADSADEKTVVRKPGFVSALLSPGLTEALKEKQIGSLILCGLSTSGCVLSTCRAATDAGYLVTVVEDACCDRTPELHQALVEHVLSTTAHVAKGEEIREAFKTV